MDQPELYQRALRFLDQTTGCTPAENNREIFFRTWQGVSLALQKLLRARIPELAFRDLERLQDRNVGRSLVVYSASRLYYGKPCTEFTYDVAEPRTLEQALRLTGKATIATLGPLERRLDCAGQRALARRYSPVWYQDVIQAVRARPK